MPAATAEPAGPAAAAAAPAPRPRAGALGQLLTIGADTFRQMARMRIFVFLALFAVALAAVLYLFVGRTNEQELKMIKNVGLAAQLFFSCAFAIAGTAILIPKDVEDRTLYTILSKPVARWTYLAGRLLGVCALILVSQLVLHLLLVSALAWREHGIVSSAIQAAEATGRQVNPQALAQYRAELDTQGLNGATHAAALAHFLRACSLAALCLLASCFATSTLFTIFFGASAFIIGSVQWLARDYVQIGGRGGILGKAFAGALAVFFPDFSLFSLEDAAADGVAVPLRLVLAAVGIAAVYILVYLGAAALAFSRKDL